MFLHFLPHNLISWYVSDTGIISIIGSDFLPLPYCATLCSTLTNIRFFQLGRYPSTLFSFSGFSPPFATRTTRMVLWGRTLTVGYKPTCNCTDRRHDAADGRTWDTRTRRRNTPFMCQSLSRRSVHSDKQSFNIQIHGSRSYNLITRTQNE